MAYAQCVIPVQFDFSNPWSMITIGPLHGCDFLGYMLCPNTFILLILKERIY